MQEKGHKAMLNHISLSLYRCQNMTTDDDAISDCMQLFCVPSKKNQ